MSFTNKVIAITGAASGIGLATAHHLLSLGASISIADSDRGTLRQAILDLEAQHPGTSVRVYPFILDVRDSASVSAWISAVIVRFGRLDGAANVAGVLANPVAGIPTRDISDAEWDRVMGVNLTGMKNCLKAELRVMNRGGSVVNMTSVAGFRGMVNGVIYAVTKAGIISLTRCAAKEEGQRGIRVNCIAPGFIDTPLTDVLEDAIGKEKMQAVMSAAPLARKGSSHEVATVVAFLLSDDSSFITGAVQVVDGGFTV